MTLLPGKYREVRVHLSLKYVFLSAVTEPDAQVVAGDTSAEGKAEVNGEIENDTSENTDSKVSVCMMTTEYVSVHVNFNYKCVALSASTFFHHVCTSRTFEALLSDSNICVCTERTQN